MLPCLKPSTIPHWSSSQVWGPGPCHTAPGGPSVSPTKRVEEKFLLPTKALASHGGAEEALGSQGSRICTDAPPGTGDRLGAGRQRTAVPCDQRSASPSLPSSELYAQSLFQDRKDTHDAPFPTLTQTWEPPGPPYRAGGSAPTCGTLLRERLWKDC